MTCSARNHLQGTVVRVTDEQALAEVVLEVNDAAAVGLKATDVSVGR